LKVTRKNLEDELALSKANLERYEQLLREGVEAAQKKEEVEREYLQTKRRYDDLEAEVIQNQINIENIKGRIAVLEGGRSTDRSTKEAEIQGIVQVLKGEIDRWREDFLLKAPISGQVAFTQFWSENQSVQAGQKVMTIVPKSNEDAPGNIIGRAKLSPLGSGKVDTGRVVNIDFPAYPSSEFGILKGKVTKISDIPEEGQFLIEIQLPDSLVTTYGKTIQFRQGMVGQGEIITDKRRFLTRLLEKLLDAIYNR
jgi:multidrug resistance efflux pump